MFLHHLSSCCFLLCCICFFFKLGFKIMRLGVAEHNNSQVKFPALEIQNLIGLAISPVNSLSKIFLGFIWVFFFQCRETLVWFSPVDLAHTLAVTKYGSTVHSFENFQKHLCGALQEYYSICTKLLWVRIMITLKTLSRCRIKCLCRYAIVQNYQRHLCQSVLLQLSG